MGYEKYPAEALCSMDVHLRMTKLYMANWTLQELVEIEASWRSQTAPEDYLKAIADEIKKRDLRNS